MNAVTRYLASRNNRFFRVSLGLATALGLWGLRLQGFDLVFILAALVVLLIAALLARKYRGEIPVHSREDSRSTTAAGDG